MSEPWTPGTSTLENAIVEVCVTFHAETPRAIRVSNTGKNEDAVWLAKFKKTGEPMLEFRHKTPAIVLLEIPLWLAKQEKFI